MDDPINNDVDARGFSVRMGYYLARASEAAYEEDCDWIAEFRPNHRVTLFNCGEFRGLVGFQEKFTVLAFRGTQSVGNFLTDADTLSVQIVVHTDATGSEEFNRLQSQQRADLLAGYLQRHGVAARRLFAHGAGEAEPLSTAPTAEGRDLNRRVELVIGALSS